MPAFEVLVERCQETTVVIEAEDQAEAVRKVPQATELTNPGEWETVRWTIERIELVENDDVEAS